jgi:hypothetical protein
MNSSAQKASASIKRSPYLTKHAWERSNARGLSSEAIDAAIQYGRVVHVRGAAVHVIGKKEVRRFSEVGVDLEKYEGVQVVCSPDDEAVLTAYRNHDLRGLRPHHRRSHH